MFDWPWYVYTSLIFWVMVAWIARSPRVVQLPPAETVMIHRARRHGVPVTVVVDPVAPSGVHDSHQALPSHIVASPALEPAATSTLLALPPGAIAAPGQVAARPMPASTDW